MYCLATDMNVLDKPTHVTTYKKGKGMLVMVSAAFWGDGQRSDLLILG